MWKEPIELTRAIRRWARGDEDLAQDMRLAAWRAATKPGLDQKYSTWSMIQAARYVRVDAFRKASRTVLCEDLDSGQYAPQTQPVESWSPLLARVPADLLRRILDGVELAELGAAEGVTGGAIWARHRKILDELRAELEP